MFAWYRRAALTIDYLSDVPPSSKSSALARVFGKEGVDSSRVPGSESRPLLSKGLETISR